MEEYIYLDVFFLRVFLMNGLCLLSVGFLNRQNISGSRLILGSAAGALWNGILVLAGIRIYGMSMLTAGCMYGMTFGFRGKSGKKLGTILLFLIAFCMEGSIRWFHSWIGIFFPPVVCFFLGQKSQKQNQELRVILTFRGKKQELEGFLDTGNRLMEPLTGKMVHLVCYEKIREILPESYRQAVEYYFENERLDSTKVSELQMYEFTFLSYHSIGKENGQLLGIRMDSAEFIGYAGKKTEEKVLIGLTEQRLFVRGRDRMIVNGRFRL